MVGLRGLRSRDRNESLCGVLLHRVVVLGLRDEKIGKVSQDHEKQEHSRKAEGCTRTSLLTGVRAAAAAAWA